MFSKILIANRGEIALRIIRAAKELGIKTVAVYSEPDRESLHTLLADERVCIGPAPASESYLNIPNIISAAEITKAEAIHPGYGFLAENPRFAEICEAEGLVFIGPPASIIKLMGDKNQARQEMKKAKLPIIPGSQNVIEDFQEAKKLMRIVTSPRQLEEQFSIAQSEAQAAFGNPALYLEKFLVSARHIEIQIVADKHGHVLGLEERECSIQRKHQKLIEESPSPLLQAKTRKRMLRAAEEAAKAIGYQSLGTFEFLVDQDQKFYFMEANTRIQVEHPVTEMQYNLDLIKEQIRLASGEKLSLSPSQLPQGHSLECRINAEDPHNFVPSPGKIDFLVFPGGPGVRVDSAAYSGWTVPPYYDSLLAKIIVHAPTRQEAITKMYTALETMTIVGIKTNLPLHLKILSSTDFLSGRYDIQFLERFLAQGKATQPKKA